MKVLLPVIFALCTAMCWGMYGPTIGNAQSRAWSPFKPYVFIGIAYLVLAIGGGLIAMKLKGLGRGVTVLGGLPVPVTTCGHGTGYDIVGQGVANDASMRNAFNICVNMARARIANGGAA